MFKYELYFNCEFDLRNYIHWELDETRKFLLVAFFPEERMSTWCLSGLGSQQTWTSEDMCTSYLSCNCQQVCIHAVQKGVVRHMCFFNVFPTLSSEEDGMLAGWNSRERAC